MSKTIHITSSAHFQTTTSASTYVVVDFYADWCGPCKTIAPIFEQLSAKETKPGKIVFAKVDVDAQQSIAQKYGVSAMPTFLILKNGTTSETIQGADPNRLRTAVLAASAAAAKSPARQSAVFSSKGQVLGGGGSGSTTTNSSSTILPNIQLPSVNASALGTDLISSVVRFFALYFVTLFSLDAYAAAEGSAFAAGSGGRTGSSGRAVGRIR